MFKEILVLSIGFILTFYILCLVMMEEKKDGKTYKSSK